MSRSSAAISSASSKPWTAAGHYPMMTAVHEFVPHERAKQEELARDLKSMSKPWCAASSSCTKPPHARPSRLPLAITYPEFLRCKCAPSSKQPSNVNEAELKYYLRSCTPGAGPERTVDSRTGDAPRRRYLIKKSGIKLDYLVEP